MRFMLAGLLRRAADRLNPPTEPTTSAPVWPVIITSPPLTWPATNVGGYPCSNCGTFVPYGITHLCNGFRITCNATTLSA